MTSQATFTPSPDPTLAVAERQLALLGELAEIAMNAARAFGASAVAAAEAEQRILTEEYFTPEVGRARACGAKDAADSLQKASCAVRLTLKLEMAVAEIVRDIRAGIVTHSAGTAPLESAGGTSADHGDLQFRRGPAGSSSNAEARDRDRRDCDAEHLVEFERPDILLGGPFKAAVDGLCADLGVEMDWIAWKVAPPDLDYDAAPPSRSRGFRGSHKEEPPSSPRTPRDSKRAPVGVAARHFDGEAVGLNRRADANAP